jgi:hypothetical protein
VSFYVGDKRFSIHEYLLEKYWPNWNDDFDNMLSSFGITVVVFRGLIHWLYHGDIVDDETIGETDLPDEWLKNEKPEPLALRMAIELYFVGQDYGIKHLQDCAMSVIFHYHKKTRAVPGIDSLQKIYLEDGKSMRRGNCRGHLQLFCADLYYHLGCENVSTLLDVNTEKEQCPREFLENFLRRRFQLLKGSTASHSVLKLKDYLLNPEAYPDIDTDPEKIYKIE